MECGVLSYAMVLQVLMTRLMRKTSTLLRYWLSTSSVLACPSSVPTPYELSTTLPSLSTSSGLAYPLHTTVPFIPEPAHMDALLNFIQ
eukprot:833760-Rhodomonas_salina.1